MPNRVGGSGGEKVSADTSFSAVAGQHFVGDGGGGEISAANMSICDTALAASDMSVTVCD